MPPLMPVLLLLTACSGRDAAVQAPEAALVPATDALGPAAGWGAVFWRAGLGWKVGEGSVLVGPRAVGGRATGAVGACGGVPVVDAPDRATLAAPVGTAPQAPVRPAVVAAPVVEAAAWRLDEVLPEPDGFSPLNPDAAPPRQRGVVVGSVIKQRRSGGPPVYLAVGARDCTAAAVVVDHEARTTLDAVVLPGICGPVRALPPAELDGTPGLETALFDDESVVLLRLGLSSASATIDALGQWRCPLESAAQEDGS